MGWMMDRRRARKEHPCGGCEHPIQVGEDYSSRTYWRRFKTSQKTFTRIYRYHDMCFFRIWLTMDGGKKKKAGPHDKVRQSIRDRRRYLIRKVMTQELDLETGKAMVREILAIEEKIGLKRGQNRYWSPEFRLEYRDRMEKFL